MHIRETSNEIDSILKAQNAREKKFSLWNGRREKERGRERYPSHDSHKTSWIRCTVAIVLSSDLASGYAQNSAVVPRPTTTTYHPPHDVRYA